MIAFSYSLAVDASPGTYNFEIARRMRRDLENMEEGVEVSLYTQWETFDALTSIKENQNPQFKLISEKAVSPPGIEEKELAKPHELLSFLQANPMPASQLFWKEIVKHKKEVQLGKVEDNLVLILNKILKDRKWYEAFVG
ncbi:MAG: hypothetical protein AAF696_34570, partial [Bacteroidota bacterium]